jgi:DNA binding domain, excisionase family
MNGWLRVKSAAKYCDISERTLRTWITEGLPHSKVRGIVLIKTDNLEQFLEQFEIKKNEVDHVVNEVLSDL